jgi:hypothetical protein
MEGGLCYLGQDTESRHTRVGLINVKGDSWAFLFAIAHGFLVL